MSGCARVLNQESSRRWATTGFGPEGEEGLLLCGGGGGGWCKEEGGRRKGQKRLTAVKCGGNASEIFGWHGLEAAKRFSGSDGLGEEEPGKKIKIKIKTRRALWFAHSGWSAC